jgi:Bacterial PH domain
MGSLTPVGRKKRAGATGGPQTFRSPTAVVIWWVWLLFAVANLIDLAVQGRDHLSLVAAAILVLATGVAYVTAQRPRLVADSGGVTVINPLRNHHVGWAGVTKVDLADMLRIHTRDKTVHSWAVQYSRRRKLAAEAKARRTAMRASSGRRSSFGTFGLENYGLARRDLGYGSPPAQAASAAEAEAERIARVLTEYATAARAEVAWAGGTVEIAGVSPAPEPEPEPGPESEPARDLQAAVDHAAIPQMAGWVEPLKSTWDSRAVLTLLIPALILLVIALI